MYVERTALKDLIKLRRSGMGSVGAHRPLLTELSVSPPILCEAGDACKVQSRLAFFLGADVVPGRQRADGCNGRLLRLPWMGMLGAAMKLRLVAVSHCKISSGRQIFENIYCLI